MGTVRVPLYQVILALKLNIPGSNFRGTKHWRRRCVGAWEPVTFPLCEKSSPTHTCSISTTSGQRQSTCSLFGMLSYCLILMFSIILVSSRREVRQNLWVPLHKTLAQVKVALLDFYGQPYRDRKVYVQKREKQPDMPVILQTRLRSARRSPVVANGSEGPTIEDEFTAPTTEAAAEASIKIAGPTRRSTRSAGTAGSAPVASSSSSSSSITAPRRSSRKK